MRVIFTTFMASAMLLSSPHVLAEHEEFEALLQVPFHADSRGQRVVVLRFTPPDGGRHRLRWRLDLLPRHDETVVRSWRGEQVLGGGEVEVQVPWRAGVPKGVYRMKLQARLDDGSEVEQSWPLAVGPTPRAIPAKAADRATEARPAAARATAATTAAAPATVSPAGDAAARTAARVADDALARRRVPAAIAADAGLAPRAATARPGAVMALPGAAEAVGYDVYLGNLHSQTNHSDGGGALDQCHGAQNPQSGAFGPTDAYLYAQQHGLDFLMTSEHNHMYDGSDRTAADADASTARALYQDGLRQAAQWNTKSNKLLALYGQEWGTISQGGHINILNADGLLGWEHNAEGELLADNDTPKNNYATLYQLMNDRGWHGQFNHPAKDQFNIDGTPLAWNADGDHAMLLCEVMNTSAYSTNTSESETRRSNFESSCNALLEAGYHLAFSSNQDNHCANWGAAYSNRTAVLIPRNTPLTAGSLLAALQARRVYATMDKHAQLIFTANGNMMGQRIRNSGKLTLQLHYSSGNGRSASAVAIFQGVPGRNGKVTAVGSKTRHSLTPLPGEHFYYARVTQDDGKIIWSAPIWVTQQAR